MSIVENTRLTGMSTLGKTRHMNTAKKMAPLVNDLGPTYVVVEADSAFEAFSAALDYMAKTYPDVTYAVEGPSPIGCYNGALITGVQYVVRGQVS